MKDYFEIDGYKFDNNIIEMFKDLYMKTTLQNIEFGFDLCRNENTEIIYSKNICKGTKCTIKTKKECDDNEIYVGNCHTHPEGNPASLQDIMNAYVYGMVIILEERILFYIRTINPNMESYDLMYEYYNKYNDYETKHGELSESLSKQRQAIKNIIIENIFSVTELEIE